MSAIAKHPVDHGRWLVVLLTVSLLSACSTPSRHTSNEASTPAEACCNDTWLSVWPAIDPSAAFTGLPTLYDTSLTPERYVYTSS